MPRIVEGWKLGRGTKDHFSWYSDFEFDGRRIRRSLETQNKREAEVASSRLYENLRSGMVEKPSNAPGHASITWEAFLEEIERVNPGNKEPNSRKRDRMALSILERCFPELGPREKSSSLTMLSQINPQKLSELVDYRVQEDVESSTIWREQGSLKSLMRWAEGYYGLMPQDWRSVAMCDLEENERHAHTPEKFKLLLDQCGGVWLTVALLGAHAGLRRTELYNLEWSDVDFRDGLINVRNKKALKDGEGNVVRKRLKTKSKKNRVVPLLPTLRAHLLSLRRHGPYVLDREDGTRPTPDSITVYVTRLTKQAGLQGGVHTLRHTFGTVMVKSGVNLAALQKMMGHSNIKTTMLYVNGVEANPANLAAFNKTLEYVPVIPVPALTSEKAVHKAVHTC